MIIPIETNKCVNIRSLCDIKCSSKFTFFSDSLCNLYRFVKSELMFCKKNHKMSGHSLRLSLDNMSQTRSDECLTDHAKLTV